MPSDARKPSPTSLDNVFANRFDKEFSVKPLRRERMEEVVRLDLQPFGSVRTHPAAGNHEVHVGMIGREVMSPGMQHPEEAELVATKVLGFLQ